MMKTKLIFRWLVSALRLCALIFLIFVANSCGGRATHGWSTTHIGRGILLGGFLLVLCQVYVFRMDLKQETEASSREEKRQVSYLQAQIAPHFLFNTLHNLQALQKTDPDKAELLLTHICEFLRLKYKFDDAHLDEYRLGDEVDFLNAYVAIENFRKAGKLKLEFYFEEENVLDLRGYETVPQQVLWYQGRRMQPMLLQPLVENAIRHGYRQKELCIVVRVRAREPYLEFVVEDNGRGMAEPLIHRLNAGKSGGVGISNINDRLLRQCGEQLYFTSQINRGTRVVFRYRMEG